MFGGDEVGALVMDLGSSYVKAGMAGEGVPRSVFPTVVGVPIKGAGDKTGHAGVEPMSVDQAEDTEVKGGSPSAAAMAKMQRYIGEDALYRRDDTDVQYPVQFGLVADWDAVEQVWEYVYKKQLYIDSKEHPIMFADRAFASKERRERMLELMFEKFEAPGVYPARAPVLGAFGVGKTSALVLDSGGGLTSCVPVHDGYVLNKGIRRTKMGGRYVDRMLEELLFTARSRRQLFPRYQIKREAVGNKNYRFTTLEFPNTSPSYHRHMCLDVVKDLKESVCRVSEVPFDLQSSANIPSVQYELPDGKVLDIRMQRFAATEKMFAPGTVQIHNDLDSSRGFVFQGFRHMVETSVNAVDVDVRRELYASIVVTGGNSLFPGFSERLYRDIQNVLAPALKAKIHTANTRLDRKFGVWLGGSVLGSLGSFHQMWISKAEFKEFGQQVLFRKCP